MKELVRHRGVSFTFRACNFVGNSMLPCGQCTKRLLSVFGESDCRWSSEVQWFAGRVSAFGGCLVGFDLVDPKSQAFRGSKRVTF